MIVVTHEMGFAREVADRVVFFDGGKVVESAPPAVIFSQPKEARTRQFWPAFCDAYRSQKMPDEQIVIPYGQTRLNV